MHHLASLLSTLSSSSNFQNIDLNYFRMHHYASFFSQFSLQFQHQKSSFQIALESTIQRSRLLLTFSQQFQLLKTVSNLTSFIFENIVLNSVRTHHIILSLISKRSQLFQLQIFYSVRIHHLLSLLSTCSHHFQLPKTSF